MAAIVEDHIHLGTGNPPVGEYKVISPTWDPTPMVPLATDQALNGAVHVHVLRDDEGNVIQFCADRGRLKLSNAEWITLKALIGETVYFVPNYHDDDEDEAGSLEEWPDSDYVVRGVLNIRPGGVVNADPMATKWYVEINIIDTGKVT